VLSFWKYEAPEFDLAHRSYRLSGHGRAPASRKRSVLCGQQLPLIAVVGDRLQHIIKLQITRAIGNNPERAPIILMLRHGKNQADTQSGGGKSFSAQRQLRI
jgi:hypothetical protein